MVALVNRRDRYHARAEGLAGRYEGHRFLTTDAVLLEIGDALARNFRPQAAETVEHFLASDDSESARLAPELLAEAFVLDRSHRDKEWGLADCVSFAAMRRAGVREALTFDQHFIQAGFRILMRDAG